MSGHGEKFGRKQEAAIGALLDRPTLGAAADAAGVSEPTLRRWLAEPDFQAAYRAARRRVVEGAIARLQQAATKAASALERNLECGTPAVEVRAALGILDQSIKGAELLDLEERLEALEQRIAASGPRANGRH